ncbi:hypothetical protein V8G54_026633 [Vigna mungo]|uniref:Uncharacterized protein n=1 Tax=Vigna mungo TaxID=3915 RepID=A0AAQ3RMB9_VIGMU
MSEQDVIFSPKPKCGTQYLNITLNNIVKVFATDIDYPTDELVCASLLVATNKPPTRSVDDILSKFIPPWKRNPNKFEKRLLSPTYSVSFKKDYHLLPNKFEKDDYLLPQTHHHLLKQLEDTNEQRRATMRRFSQEETTLYSGHHNNLETLGGTTQIANNITDSHGLSQKLKARRQGIKKYRFLYRNG